jgi:hypothetical protein
MWPLWLVLHSSTASLDLDYCNSSSYANDNNDLPDVTTEFLIGFIDKKD